MLLRPLLPVLLVCCFAATRAWGGDKASPQEFQAIETLLEKQDAAGLRTLGDKAIPALAHLLKQGKHQAQILPILLSSQTKPARTALEQALAAEEHNDWIYWQARALGLLKHPESKPVLLKTIRRVTEQTKALGGRGTPADEPNPLGVMFGGSTDCAQFALIWALGRIEGKEFGTSWLTRDPGGEYMLAGSLDLNDLCACLEWWRGYKKTIEKSAPKSRGRPE